MYSGLMFGFVKKFFNKDKERRGSKLVEREKRLSEINMQLNAIEDSVSRSNVKKTSKEFFELVKKSFKQLMGLHYQATFQELQEEVTKRKKEYPEEFRKQVHIFLDKVSVMEYGYPEFRSIVKNEHRDREALLRQYIKDMEIEGDHIKRETKKRIYSIINDEIPHDDHELLLKVAAEFRELINHV